MLRRRGIRLNCLHKISVDLTPTKRGVIIGMYEAGVIIIQIAIRRDIARSTVRDAVTRWPEHDTKYSLPPILDPADHPH